MALPDIADVCVHAEIAADLKIRFPGGFTLQIPGVGIPNPGEQVAKLLAALNSALAPFKPVLDIIDALLAAVDVFDAVKSLNPIKIGATLVDFVAIVDRLKGLLPPLSFPILIKDIVIVLRLYALDVRAQLVALAAAQVKIAAANERAQILINVGLPDAAAQLSVATECATLDVSIGLASIQANAMPVNRIIGITNLLGSIIGLGELPSITVGADISVAIEGLDALTAALGAIEAGLPV